MSVRLAVLVLTHVVAALALAQSALAAPEALSKTEIACQSTTAKALGQYAKARTSCIAKCEKKTSLSSDCTTPFANKTLECVQKADAKLAAVLAKKCQSDGTDDDSCPECYEELNGTCAAFDAALTTDAVTLTDALAAIVFCDDTASPDGLTKAEAKCQAGLVAAVASYASASSACVTSCLKNERKGKTDGTCNPQALIGLNGDTKTLACLFKAFVKLSKSAGKCEPPRGDAPECLSDIGTLFTVVQLGITQIGVKIDVCPAQCGDGFTQGLEQCDPPGSTCPGNTTCTAQCTCPGT